MKYKSAAITLSGIVVVLTLAWSSIRQTGSETTFTDPNAGVHVRVQQILPNSNNQTVTETDPHSTVEFRYKVTNISRLAFENLRLGVSCRCQIINDVPPKLSPGESCEIGFTVVTPAVETKRESIQLISDNRLIWRFLAVVTAKVKAPIMIDKSNIHKLTFIANKGEYSELSISTIEKADSTEWIDGLQVAQPELLRLTKKTSTCEPYVAAGLCKRVYRFEFELLQQKPISRNIA